MNNKTYRAAIFDMDGTILDTAEDLAAAINYAMAQCGHRHDFTREQAALFFGSGVQVALRRALAFEKGRSYQQLFSLGRADEPAPAAEETALVEKLRDYYLPYYRTHNAIKSGPFPGICTALQQLQQAGRRLAVVSNKPHDAVVALAEKYFPGLFELAIGEQAGLARKPAPDMVQLALQKMGLTASQAVYVGDTEIDMETAENSQMDCLSVAWGFRDAATLKKLGAPLVIYQPEELVKII